MSFVGGFNPYQLLVSVYLIEVIHFSTILSFLTFLEYNLSQCLLISCNYNIQQNSWLSGL